MPVEADWIILDTSALVAFLAQEAGAKTVAAHRAQLAIPFIVLTELTYLVWHRRGEEEAVAQYTLVTKWGRPILWPDERVLLTAARLKAQYALGLADSYIAAFAKVYQAPLLTGDRDYQPLAGEIALLPLR